MRLARAALGALLLATACEGRPHRRTTSAASQPRSGPALVVLDVRAGLPEKEAAALLSPPSGRRRAFDSLLRVIAQTRERSDTKGYFVRFGSASLGIARAEELGELLADVRKKTPVYCHADGFGNASILTAALGCTKITLSPAGEVETVGLGAQIVYLHKLLAEQLHVDVDILQVGKFKGAEEPLTRDGPSPEARESLESVLVDLRAAWLDGVAKGRAGHPEARAAAEDGPFSPADAKARGLVDAIGYADDARDDAKKEASAVRSVVRYGPGSGSGGADLDDVLGLFAGDDSSTPQVMVVRAVGSITMGGGGGLFGSSSGITEKAMARRIKRVSDDDAVRAVVLRIDSPGGSALASDLIWHELMKLRAKKPLIVSVGGMAASGGYYLASTGTEIYAEPTSIVGSIGVVGGKIGIGDTLEQVGVHVETFPAKVGDEAAKARAGYESPFIKWDDPTRTRVLASMKGVYDLFLSRVAEGRKIPVEKVAASAEGRIFSGAEGKKRGLVDTLGGLGAAVARAKELGGLPSDALVRVFPTAPRLADLLGSGPDARAPGIDPSKLEAPSRLETYARATMPEAFVFAESLAPLAEREHYACALPFGLIVR